MSILSDALSLRRSSTADALAIFDSLEPVDIDFMIGAWKGAGFPTGHPLDGLLEAYHWHGKRFESAEDVHPLVFGSRTGRKSSVDPAWMIPFINLLRGKRVPKSKLAGRLFQICIPLFTTRRARARLCMTHYRGKESATMIYDNLPINDVFRKVNEKTVLGLMDLKGLERPFFFILRRE